MLATLGIAFGGLGILTVIGLVTLAVGAVGCGGEEEKVTDAAPPQEDAGTESPDPFAKDETYPNIEPDSYKAIECLWTKEKIKDAKLDNWHKRARQYVGTADQLYKPVASDPALHAEAGKYTDAVKAFFEDHYKSAADKSENGILVLMAGLAPTQIEENVMFGAIDAIGKKTDGKETEYVELLKAWRHFNKAVEKADKRFSKPSGSKLNANEKEEAKKELEKATKIIERFIKMSQSELNKALTDDQQDLLFFLQGAAEDYAKTLGKGGGIIDICKINPNDPRCKGGGTRQSIVPGAED